MMVICCLCLCFRLLTGKNISTEKDAVEVKSNSMCNLGCLYDFFIPAANKMWEYCDIEHFLIFLA